MSNLQVYLKNVDKLYTIYKYGITDTYGNVLFGSKHTHLILDHYNKGGILTVKHPIIKEVLDWVAHIAIAVGIGFLIVTYVAQITVVNGTSMENTLHHGDRLIIEKISPRVGNIHRGDIVTINDPDNIDKERSPIIKRVIGVEGDLVEIRDGKVFVNGKELIENYINGDKTYIVNEKYRKVKVEPGQIFVLGDNRLPGRSLDSRSIGPEGIDKVNGKAVLRFFPFNKFGLL